MADLLVPEDKTGRPWLRAGRDDVPDRAGALADALEEADRPASGIAIAQVPDWVVEQVDQVSYPTRMARRRALEAAQVVDDWQPDASVTRPVLTRVEDELTRLLDRRYEPVEDDEADVADDTCTGEAEHRPVRATAVAVTSDLLPSGAGTGRRGRRWFAGVAAAVVLLGGAGLVAVTRGGPGRDGLRPTSVVAPQRVVAVALARGGQLTGVSLLASGSGTPQQVLVPSRLLLDVPGAGRLPVAQSLAPGSSAPGAAIADALEVRVAGTWVLDTSALSRLVDRVGGVTVDVDVDVRKGDGAGAAILVTAGPRQRLTGAQAAAFAQALGDDEPEASRLARQEQVVTALLSALPADAAQRRALVVALPGAPTGDVLDSVLAVTGALKDAAIQDAVASIVVPTRDIDTGGSVTAYGLDSAAAATMVRARLSGAEIAVPPGGRLRVLVQNGDGTPGLGDAARSKLVAAGLRYVGGGNVDGFGVPQTVVLLPDGSSASRAKGLAVTRALGLADDALRISDSNPTVADLVVVLGSDFRAR